MTIKASKLTAISVAFAVWLAYSVPVAAMSRINFPGLATGVVQTDDDDDDLSGGALAVLLLAVGGAVAGVLYAAHGSDKITCDRASNEVTLRMSRNDANGKGSQNTWTGKLDDKSGMLTLIRKAVNAASRASQRQWKGKVDGKYYSVTGYPKADEISYTKIDANTIEFSAKKGDKVTLTGRMT